MAATNRRRHCRTDADAYPLAGLVVATFERAIAAPLCTRHLADLGTRVIKVENPNGGDFTCAYDTAVRGLASTFVWLDRNKESLTLDVKRPTARRVLDRLLDRADIVVQNLAPGAAHRLGVDAETLTGQHPRIVAVDMSEYGTGGPLAHKRAFDLLVQAEGGSCAVTGWPGGTRSQGYPVVDVGTGMCAFSSILAALFARERSGRGAMISVSMFDTIAEWMGFAVNYTMHTGLKREPNGLSSPTVASVRRGSHSRRADDCARHNQRPAVATARDSIAGPSRSFRRRALRHECRPVWPAMRAGSDHCGLDGAAAARRVTGPRRRGRASGTPGSTRVPDVIAHTQLSERDRWREIDSEVVLCGRSFRHPRRPTQPRMDGVPAGGQHTDSVLRDLGFGPHDIDELREDGVVR